MTSNGTSAVAQTGGAARSGRVDWVDYAKGICIIMVVMMHSVLGVELAAGETGFMHLFVAFAKPFRMPDFFLISGLFLPLVIDRDWRTYLDRKVVHFAYFYVLWVTIQFGFKAPGFAAESSWAHAGYLYLESFIEPFGTLWFIYLLPIFFVVTKATRRVPPLLVWAIAAMLEMAHVSTGWTAIDEFGARFVYFYTGYLFADAVFALSNRARTQPVLALAALAIWAIANEGLVKAGVSEWPVISLMLGIGRRLRRHHGRDLAGADAMDRLRPLLRRAFDRDLPRLLPADGCDADASLAHGHHPRRRRDVADGHASGAVRRIGDLADRAQVRCELPVRAPRSVLDRAEESQRDPAGGGIARRKLTFPRSSRRPASWQAFRESLPHHRNPQSPDSVGAGRAPDAHA